MDSTVLIVVSALMICAAWGLVLWVRSASGWAPGTTFAGAIKEIAARAYPRPPLSIGRVRARLWRLVKSQVLIDAQGVTIVPTGIDVRLAPADLSALGGTAAFVASDLADRLVSEARRRRWKLTATPEISLVADPDRPIGRPLAQSDFANVTVIEPAGPGDPRATVKADSVTLESTDGTVVLRLDSGPYRIGRDRSVEIRVKDEAVSRKHALLERTDAGWRICDTRSTNGVKVNGKSVQSALLASGDTITLSSKSSFRFIVVTHDPKPGLLAPEDPTDEGVADHGRGRHMRPESAAYPGDERHPRNP